VGQIYFGDQAGKWVRTKSALTSKPKSQAYGCSIHYGLGDTLKNLFKPAG